MKNFCCDVCGQTITASTHWAVSLSQKGVRGGKRRFLLEDVCDNCLPQVEAMFCGKPAESKPTGGRPVTVDRKKILQLAKAGWPVEKIVDEMKCGKTTVYRVLEGLEK